MSKSEGNGKVDPDADQNETKKKVKNPHKARCISFLHFLFNPKTKEIMGRTCLGWLKLLAYYIVFYGFLVAFWAAFFEFFWVSVDPRFPRYAGSNGYLRDSSRNNINPSMSFRPQPDPTATILRVTPNDNTTYGGDYVPNLNQYLQGFVMAPNAKKCTPTDKTEFDVPCFFDVSRLGPCGSVDPNALYGYNTPTPCLVFKANRVIGFIPTPITCFSNGSCDGLSSDDQQFFQRQGRPGVALPSLFNGVNIPFTCQGVYDNDNENILQMTWFPTDTYGSLESFMFPFMNQPNYTSPLVAAQIQVTRGVLVMLRCRIWGKNIANVDTLTREGSLLMEFMVQ